MGANQGVKNVPYIACGYQQITTITTSTALTVPSNASWAMIQCEAQPVRWRDDGTAPTATVGMMMAVGDILIYDGTIPNLTALRFIESTVGAKLNVSYYS